MYFSQPFDDPRPMNRQERRAYLKFIKAQSRRDAAEQAKMLVKHSFGIAVKGDVTYPLDKRSQA